MASDCSCSINIQLLTRTLYIINITVIVNEYGFISVQYYYIQCFLLFFCRQEGWRLEHENPQDPKSPILFKGVVFNEMKGVFVS